MLFLGAIQGGFLWGLQEGVYGGLKKDHGEGLWGGLEGRLQGDVIKFFQKLDIEVVMDLL